jgi:hypothetical protein
MIDAMNPPGSWDIGNDTRQDGEGDENVPPHMCMRRLDRADNA